MLLLAFQRGLQTSFLSPSAACALSVCDERLRISPVVTLFVSVLLVFPPYLLALPTLHPPFPPCLGRLSSSLSFVHALSSCAQVWDLQGHVHRTIERSESNGLLEGEGGERERGVERRGGVTQ